MPNHYTTEITVTGPIQLRNDFKEKHIAKDQLDFNTVIPMPEDIKKSDSTVGKDGTFPKWYSWSCENWGTKWNSYDLDVIEDNPKRLRFSIHTAWAPPTPILDKLKKLWPNLAFEVIGRDEFEEEWSEVE